MIVGAAGLPALFSELNRPQSAAEYKRLPAQEGTNINRGKVKESNNRQTNVAHEILYVK